MTTIFAGGATTGTKSVSTTPAAVWTPVPVPTQAPAHEGIAELPGTRLWYWDTGGSGRPVILMHAATHSAAGWVYQQPALASAGYRAIAYSRRGYYRSDPGDPANPGCAADDLDNLIAASEAWPGRIWWPPPMAASSRWISRWLIRRRCAA